MPNERTVTVRKAKTVAVLCYLAGGMTAVIVNVIVAVLR